MTEEERLKITDEVELLLIKYIQDVQKESRKPIVGLSITYLPGNALWVKVLRK